MERGHNHGYGTGQRSVDLQIFALRGQIQDIDIQRRQTIDPKMRSETLENRRRMSLEIKGLKRMARGIQQTNVDLRYENPVSGL